MKRILLVVLFFGSKLVADEVVLAPVTEVVIEATQKAPIEEKEEVAQPSKQIEQQNNHFQNAIFKTLFSIAGFIFLILFTIWLLKRISSNRTSFANRASALQILEKRMISPKTTLYIIEVDGKKVVFSESMMEVKVLYTEPSPLTTNYPVPKS